MLIEAISARSVVSGLGALVFLFSLSAHAKEERRRVTVQDAISITRLGDEGYFLGASPKGRVAHFSPDGKRFLVVLDKGNAERNTNEYSLLLFETSEAFRSPKARVLVTMSSSSNRMGLKDIKWLGDNSTIAFIGENRGEIPQVYAFNVDTRYLKKLTNHSTPVVSYDITPDGGQIIFEAMPPARAIVDSDETRRQGIVVTTQYLLELLAGNSYGYHVTITDGDDLFVVTLGHQEVQIPLEDRLDSGRLSLAPDGLHALVRVFVRDIPKEWADYQDGDIQKSIRRERVKGVASNLTRYMLVDTRSKVAEPLLNVPAEGHKDAALWGPDGKSVIFSGTYLPLEISDPVERKVRQSSTYVVEVGIPGNQIAKISDKDLKLSIWDGRGKRIVLESGYWWKHIPSVAYEKIDSTWMEVPFSPAETTAASPLDVTLDEDMNSPPRIFASDPKTQHKILLLDLNPQFKKLQFGKVEAITWKATDGHEVLGGLYLPPDYSSSIRYPLVIQTHGFSNDRFRIDGPWSGAFAAQPLAAKGIVVLQVGGSKNHDEDRQYGNTQNEGAREQAAYEGAVDYLDGRGLIDRSRVGIIGFSRTVYEVGYTLTHSNYKFAAATIADGIDGGYFQYLAFYPILQDSELLNGGPPSGEGLPLWLKNSPTFNLDKVKAPVRIEAFGPGAVLEGWEWFAGLSRGHKPVDFIYLPDAPHLLVKPWERMVSQQGNVDWFTFWLKSEENPDPNKREQYERWHCLRERKTACGSPLFSSGVK